MDGRKSARPKSIVPFMNEMMYSNTVCGEHTDARICLNENLSVPVAVGRSRISLLSINLREYLVSVRV